MHTHTSENSFRVKCSSLNRTKSSIYQSNFVGSRFPLKIYYNFVIGRIEKRLYLFSVLKKNQDTPAKPTRVPLLKQSKSTANSGPPILWKLAKHVSLCQFATIVVAMSIVRKKLPFVVDVTVQMRRDDKKTDEYL